jgi:mannan endo-1,4-beta-mannosidase
MCSISSRFVQMVTVIVLSTCTSFGQINSEYYNTQTVYEPVNPNATPAAKRLLAYLYSIRGRKTISGIKILLDAEDKYIYSDYIKALTRKSPELLGYDFEGYHAPGYASKLVREVYKQYLEGHIITLMWNEDAPTGNLESNYSDTTFRGNGGPEWGLSDKQWDELITPGTKLYDCWLADVDTIATYLKALQVLGVPILWRPYHEMNGTWFWWGGRKGPDGSMKLYQMMFDRYVNHFHLNNLIWVWGPNSPRLFQKNEAFDYADYFPGTDFVDVFATDIYNNDYKEGNYTQMLDLAKGKVIALSEVGQAPTPEILEAQSNWTYFMIRGDFVHTRNSSEQIEDLFGDPRVISFQNFFGER